MGAVYGHTSSVAFLPGPKLGVIVLSNEDIVTGPIGKLTTTALALLIEEDVDRCQPCFHGINIKLTKCGGMTPARRMIARARALNLKVMIGCMTESTVGISAIAQFLPLLDYVDMDGAVLIAQDVATGVRLERGRAVFPEENGNGVRLL